MGAVSSPAMPRFSADQISGPHRDPGRGAELIFTVDIGGEEGHAVVGIGDQGASFERVAAALDFEVEGSSYDDVVTELKGVNGLRLPLLT